MKRIAILAALALALGFGLKAQAPDPSTFPLVQAANLVYTGSFKVPYGVQSAGGHHVGFEYGGSAIAFDTTRGGLYLVGHDWDQFVGEISIPAIRPYPLSTLASASLLQPLTDVTEGALANINPGDPNAKKIGGLLWYLGKLYATGYSYYDGNGSTVLSHFVSGVNLSTTGDATGGWQVGTTVGTPVTHKSAGFVGGPMAIIPSEWRTLLGGPVITGQCCLAVTSRSSLGPAAFSIDPEQLGSTIPLTVKALVAYPYEHPLSPWDSSGTAYNGTMGVKGIVFPAGTRSVLFFGSIGTGPWCYGAGTTNQALNGTLTSDGITKYCYDPINQDKGTHAYPYVFKVWAYDANDLAKSAAGTIDPWTVRPYAIWPLTLPSAFGNYAGLAATYDPATGRIFLSQMAADGPGGPVIHVFTVSGAVVPPPPPPPTTCSDPAATNNGGALPCVYPSPLPTTCADATATNNGGPLPCVYPAPPPPTPTLCTDPSATNNGGTLPCVYPTPPVTTVLSVTTVPVKWELTVKDVPPDPSGGWSVQFYVNALQKLGTLDSTSPYSRSIVVTAGTKRVTAVWTKPGQTTVTRPAFVVVLP